MQMTQPQTTKIKVGDVVRVPPYPEHLVVVEINDSIPEEPVAIFKDGGFWRCAGCEVVNDE